MLPKLPLLLALLCAASPALASGSLPDPAGAEAAEVATADDCDAVTSPPPGGKPAAAASQGQDKSPIRRGGTEAATRPPRWHSFLPGMFR